jgi:hypothetical protein
MKQILQSVLALVRGRGRRPAAPVRRVRPGLEGLEERLTLSTAVPGFEAPLTGPALVGRPVAQPERCVHGYKWRPPGGTYPRPCFVGTAAAGMVYSPGGIAARCTAPSVPPAASHLITGGADGATALASGAHIIVMPPTGPAPVV